MILGAAVVITLKKYKGSGAKSAITIKQEATDEHPLILKVITFFAYSTLIIALTLQIITIIFVAPGNTDSMTYHLARVGYYIQHGNINAYNSNFWAQLMHPKNSAILMSFVALATDKWINSTQIVQFVSWLVLATSIFGICRHLEVNRRVAAIVAIAVALVPEVLMEASTTQDDLYIAALAAAFVYMSIIAINSTSLTAYIVAGLSFGIAIGVKTSALIPLASSVALLVVMAYFERGPRSSISDATAKLVKLAICCVVGAIFFALPAGYLENYRIYGNPLGDNQVLTTKVLHTANSIDAIKLYAANLVRYVVDWLDPSGLPPSNIVFQTYDRLRTAAASLASFLGLPVMSAPSLTPPYTPISSMTTRAHEDFSWWGVWGIAFFIPTMLYALIQRGRAIKWGFILASLIFCGLQATGVYDPWRGRYFIQMLAFVAPVSAIGLNGFCNRKYARLVMAAAFIVCSATSIYSLLSRRNGPFLETVKADWLAQTTRNTNELRPVFKKLNQLIPMNEPLIVSFNDAYSEFPLFGEHLQRRLYPAPDLLTLRQLEQRHIAKYVIFNQVVSPTFSDCRLGDGYYLRRIDAGKISGCDNVLVERLTDLNHIADALEGYRKAFGSYPISIGWDGFMSRWGRSDREWIRGLAPDFISSLPVANRSDDNDWAMYLYKSDGRDYKLDVIASSDMRYVQALAKKYVDPASSGKSYGIWTQGAAEWLSP
jgi:hypothetical protein